MSNPSLGIPVVALALIFSSLAPRASNAQDSGSAQDPASSRAAVIEQSQAEKAADLHPFTPTRMEAFIENVEQAMLNDSLRIHPYFESAYAGGGFTIGLGYRRHVSAYNLVDIRGSFTVKGYKRVEGAFMAPRLFDRRGSLALVGGWRDATRVGFYGIGINTSADDRANYRFTQPYGSASLDLWPTRRLLLLHGGVELSRWDIKTGEGDEPSVDTIYTPETTLLVKEARQRGCHVLTGVDMFVRQAALQFWLFTGREPPLELMRKVVRRVLSPVALRDEE